MTVSRTLQTQLRTLLQLTQTEATIAEVRIAQARTEAVRRELRQNAGKAEERSRLLVAALREAGGVPDVVTPVLGRLTAAVKSTVEQVQPFDEALLGDLALEHQLLDRARYAKALAAREEARDVEKVMDRLIEAHSATADWLTTVLAEEALGGPTALRATPLQRVAEGVSRVVALPGRYASERVNTSLSTVAAADSPAFDKVTAVAGKASEVAGSVLTALAVRRDASLQRAEGVARRVGAGRLVALVSETREQVEVPSVDELPVSGYDDLKAAEAVKAVQELDDPVDVRAVLRYERAHKDRSTVVSAAQTRVAAIAQATVGIA